MKKECCNDIFPFGKVSPGENVLIYGAGKLGNLYYEQIRKTGYCFVVGFIDKKKQNTKRNIRVFGLDCIDNLNYDHIVVAVKSISQQKIIKDDLIKKGVEENRIIPFWDVEFPMEIQDFESDGEPLACQLGTLSIAVNLCGGIGDCIVTKAFLDAVCKMSPKLKIDFYTSHKKADIEAIYRGEPYFNTVMSNEFEQYQINKCLYDVAMMLDNAPEIEWLSPHERWQEDDSQLLNVLKKIIILKEEYSNGVHYTHFMHYMRQIYLGNNCYSSLAFNGLIPIKSHNVYIPFDDIGKADFDKLKLKKYITINYGNGTSMEQADKINKQWPYKHFVKFITLFKKNYPYIKVVQIGAANAHAIEGVDLLLLGKSLEVIKHVLHGSLFHLDIEGGMVHLATQLGTKCIVLFGPTLEEFFAYPENINIRAGDCRGCWELYGADRRCAKNLPYSECMALITPEMVMRKITEAGIEVNNSEVS